MAITRVTTPTHRFTFPIDPENLEIIRITYGQNKKVILTKEKSDMRIDGNKIFVTLSQEETKGFDARFPVEIQVRALTYTGKALASKTWSRDVEEVLDDGILGN